VDITTTNRDALAKAIRLAQQRTGLRQHAGRAVCETFAVHPQIAAVIFDTRSFRIVLDELQRRNSLIYSRSTQ